MANMMSSCFSTCHSVNSLPDDQLDQTEEEHLADVVMGGSNLRGHRRLGYHRSHHPHLEGDDNMFDDVNSNHTHDEYHRNPSPSTPGLRRSRHRHGGLGSGVPLPESPSLVQHPLPSVPTFSQQRRPKRTLCSKMTCYFELPIPNDFTHSLTQLMNSFFVCCSVKSPWPRQPC